MTVRLAQLIQALLQKAPLRLQLSQLQGVPIGVPRVVQTTEAAVEIGAGRVQQVIVVELSAGQQIVDQPQASFGPFAHGHRHRAVQFDHRRGADAQQHVVEPDDLRPVGLRGAGRLGVHGDDRGLQGVGPESPRGQRTLDQRRTFLDLRPVPQAAVLVIETHQLARLIGACGAARVVQQHQREQTHQLRIRQQLEQQPAQADRLAAQADAGQLGAAGGRIALVEHQIDHPQHVIQARRQLLTRRHAVGNRGVADLLLGAHDALGDGAGRGEKGAGDFLGLQVADLAQGQRHLRIAGQCRVAAGEDQSQAIVLQPVVIPVRFLGGIQLIGQQVQRGIEACTPTQPINGLEAPSRNQPGTRVGRYAVVRPLLQRGEEGVVQRFLGQVEVTEQADQRRQHPPRLAPVDGLDRPLAGHVATR